MTIADIVGFAGYVPLMVGTYLLTTRLKKSAWSIRIVGDILLATSGYLIGLWSIVLISSSFAVMDVFGLVKEWWKNVEFDISQEPKVPCECGYCDGYGGRY